MPALGSPSGGGTKQPNNLGKLLNPLPKGPGTPTNPKSNQALLIHQILHQQPVTIKPPQKQGKGSAFPPDAFTVQTRKQDAALRNRALNQQQKSGKTSPTKTSTAPVETNYSGAASRIQGKNNSGDGGKEKFVGVQIGNKGSSGAPTKPIVDPLLSRAQETIAAQMNPQLAEYQRQIADAGTSSAQQQADLADLYRRLGVQVGADQTAGNVANTNAMQNITGDYTTLANQLNSTYGQATAGTNAELQRLGIGDVSAAATTQQGNDQKYLGGLTAIDRTNAQADSTAKSQSFNNLITTLGAQGQLAGAMDKSKVMRTAAQAISDLQSKKGALAATRRGAVDALYRQLKDAQTQRQADAAQQQFMDKITAGKLGIEQGNLGVAQGKLSLAAQNAGSQRDLRTAQALKYIHDSRRPYSSYSSSAANAPKGSGAGLSVLQGIKVGNNAAAQQAKQDAIKMFNYYYTNYGGKSITELERRITSHTANDYMNLPQEVRAALIDALRAAGTN